MSRRATYKTRGLVLSRRELGESDRLLTVFTRDRGITKFKAKGVRKIKSRMAGHLELYTEADFFIAKGHVDDVIAGVSTLESMPALRSRLDLMARAALISEFALSVVPLDEPAETLYDLTRWTLMNLGESDERLVSLYIWRLLTIAGFVSDLVNCAVCDQPLTPENVHYLPHEARFTHVACERNRPVHAASVKLIKLAAAGDYDMLRKIKVAPEVINETIELASLFLTEILKKPLKSLGFMKQLGSI